MGSVKHSHYVGKSQPTCHGCAEYGAGLQLPWAIAPHLLMTRMSRDCFHLIHIYVKWALVFKSLLVLHSVSSICLLLVSLYLIQVIFMLLPCFAKHCFVSQSLCFVTSNKLVCTHICLLYQFLTPPLLMLFYLLLNSYTYYPVWLVSWIKCI